MSNKESNPKTIVFSKDIPIVEISTKQSQTQSPNVVPSVKLKESKKIR